MTMNPYVDIKRVIDTRSNQRRIVDFLHQKTFVTTNIYANRFAATFSEEAHEGSYYVDITKSDLTSDVNFVLRNSYMPIVILDTSVDLTIDKDNFSTCKIITVNDEVVIRLYAALQPLQTLYIPTIMLIEVEGVVDPEEIRGYTNAAGGGTLSSISFDRESFIQYFESLGSINDARDRIENFLSSIAYSFESGVISADKFRTTGNNIMPRLDSFEDELGRSLMTYPIDPGVENLVINFQQTYSGYDAPPHGEAVLRMQSDIGSGPFTFYINPYTADDSTWITAAKMNYWFSYYLYTTSPTIVTGNIDLLNSTDEVVVTVPFSLDETDSWTRFYDDFELLNKEELSLRITINNGGVNLFLDAIQLEHKTILNPDNPTSFARGGKVIIEGGNIRANSISATDAIFEDAAIVSANIDTLAANKIAAGRINTDVVEVGGPDDLMLMHNNKITFFQPINGGEYAKVEIGKLVDDVIPENQQWGLIVRNQDGSAALFDENGITTTGINDGLKLAKIIDYNNIDDIYSIEGQYVSVDGSTLVAESVVASKLYAGTVEANKIQATNIAADTITAEHLNAVITTGKRILLGESVITAGIDGAGTAAGTIRFWSGSSYTDRGTAPFRVAQDGSVYGTKLFISGTSTFAGALNGATGTFSGSLSAATGSFAGSLSAATGTFNGTLSAGTVTGSTITGGTITIGSGASVFKADSNGIYLGDETFANADFRVSAAGAIRSRSGSIGGFTVGSSTLTSTGGQVKLDSTNNRIYLNTSAYLDAGTTGSDIKVSGGLQITSRITSNDAIVAGMYISSNNIQGTLIEGSLYNPVKMNGSTIITRSNFSLSGSTLTITM